MEIVQPDFSVLTVIDEGAIYSCLELYGRTAYKSEDRITKGSAERFLRTIIKNGHHSVLEHVSLTVRFICDRGVTHELVRHRLCAYTQESTRYCNYYKRGVQFIRPPFWHSESYQYDYWLRAMRSSESSYNLLIESGATPQEARSVLPNSLKTEIVTTANIREWRHILTLRTAPNAHPQMRQIMVPLLAELQSLLPVLFEDIEVV